MNAPMKKITITNDHPTPMEVLKAGVILQPGESVEIEIPDTDDKPEPAAAPPAGNKAAPPAPPPAGDKPTGDAPETKKPGKGSH